MGKVSSLASAGIQLDRLTRALSCCFSHPVMQYRASLALCVRARLFSGIFIFIFFSVLVARISHVAACLLHLITSLCSSEKRLLLASLC